MGLRVTPPPPQSNFLPALAPAEAALVSRGTTVPLSFKEPSTTLCFLSFHTHQAARYGKCFCDFFDPQRFVDTINILRVLNAVREYQVGIPMTMAQYVCARVYAPRLLASAVACGTGATCVREGGVHANSARVRGRVSA